jgi:hypothetical protein
MDLNKVDKLDILPPNKISSHDPSLSVDAREEELQTKQKGHSSATFADLTERNLFCHSKILLEFKIMHLV